MKVRSVISCLLMLGLGGCGYHWSNNQGVGATPPEAGFAWSGIYRQDVKTVAVPVFGNRTFYRGIEFSLTKSVINQMEGRTPYKVVPREQADTILEGQVVAVAVHTQSRSQTTGIPQEQLYIVSVNFTWKDLRTGKILVSRHGFEQTSPYYPTLGEDQFAGSQQNIERLGLAIVQELQADWGPKQETAQSQPGL